MQSIRVAILFAAALLLAGCLPPATSHPVGTTTGLVRDPALTGLWRGKMQNGGRDGRDVYFHFLPTQDGTITVVMVQAGDNPDGDWSVAAITTAKIGANRFINATLTFSNGKPIADSDASGSMPLLYRFDGTKHIKVFFMDEDATKVAIKSGVIQGSVEPGQFGDAKITATPQILDAFMASRAGIALFGRRFAVLTKME